MKFMRPSEEQESAEAHKDSEAWTKEFAETLPWEEQFQSRISAIGKSVLLIFEYSRWLELFDSFVSQFYRETRYLLCCWSRN